MLVSEMSICFAALFQFMSLDSREFKEILKIMSSSYLDPSSGSTFSYKKASLIHSELLEKEVGIQNIYI